MSATGAGYDQSVSTFSPNGRVFQVEYAYKAVEKASTSIGIRCVDGVVLGCEKQLASKMLTPGSNKRIAIVDYHAAIAQTGLAADARQLVNKARSEANEYQNFYGSPITGRVLSDRLALHVHTHTLYWYLRPFGCALLLGVYDEEVDGGPALYAIEPSGVGAKYHACAIGKLKQGASSELEKLDFSKVTCEQAVREIARIIYRLHDAVKEKEMELEFTWIRREGGQGQGQGQGQGGSRQARPVPREVVDEAVRLAKEAKQREEMEESDDEDEAEAGAGAGAAAPAAAAAPVTTEAAGGSTGAGSV